MLSKYVNKQTIFFSIVTILMAAMVFFGTSGFAQNREGGTRFLPARVVEIIEDNTSLNAAGARVGRQTLTARLLAGERRGDVVEVQNMLFPIENAVYARPGQRLLIFFEHQPGATPDDYFAHVQSFDRSIGIYIVIILFLFLLGAVFGKTGLRSGFSLIFTFIVLLFLLIPLIIDGSPPAIMTILCALLIIIVSLLSILGFGKKAYVAIIGSSIGIALYGIFYLFISAAIRITGFNVQEADLLIVAGFYMGVRQLLFSAILIASLGALMDVAVSIASVTAELHETNPNADFRELFRSGMKVGRDIIGSSSNTLILAFTGAFFISLILFRVHNVQYSVMINRVDIGIEVLRAISASAAMVLCAPATALIGSKVFASGSHEPPKSHNKKRKRRT